MTGSRVRLTTSSGRAAARPSANAPDVEASHSHRKGPPSVRRVTTHSFLYDLYSCSILHMHEVPVTEARAEFSELINRVAYGGEPVIITRHGKPLVALVPAAYVVENPAQGAQRANPSPAPMTVLDVTGRGGEPNGPLTVAAHHRDDPKTR